MKQAIRQNLREKRKQISPVLYAKKSALIREKLEKLPEFQKAQNILAYVSTPEEVSTHEIIKTALKNGKKIFVPRIHGDQMMVCPISDWKELKPGNFGILEPCETINHELPEQIDVILIPGIAFDARGHRIGYGRGFYDRFLSQINNTNNSKNTLKIGLAFHQQIVDEISEEEHDVPLDVIITEKQTIQPKN